MVLIVHGFPNEISALRVRTNKVRRIQVEPLLIFFFHGIQFEWAWQNPQQSVRLKHLNLPKSRKHSLGFKLKILSEMLLVGPWTRLPLTIRWLTDKKQTLERLPPFHMPITSGPIQVSKQTNTIPSKRKKNTKAASNNDEKESEIIASCFLCHKLIDVGISFIQLRLRFIFHISD